MDDLISRDFIKSLGGECIAARDSKTHELLPISSIDALPSAQPEPQWIPIKTRPMTDEERDYWSDHFGYDIGYENDTMFDCKMPEDQQPVWVQSNCGYVYEDVCENDDGMLGLEGNGDWSDIVAWMPKYVPEPWKGESSYTSVTKYKVVYGRGEEP